LAPRVPRRQGPLDILPFLISEVGFNTGVTLWYSRIVAIDIVPVRDYSSFLEANMTMRFANSAAAMLALGIAFPHGTAATGAELRILTPRAIWTVLNEIGPQFEQSSGYKLNVVTEIAATLVKRINDGEKFDIFVGPPAQINQLIQNGKITAESRTPIAKSGIGVEVRAGAPKPDISSVEAFKRALINAKSVGFLKEGASGVYLAGVLDRLGIAEAIKSKVIRPETDIVSELVAKGEIELGMVVITQILTTPGVELVGPIPQEIQSYVSWSGGVSANSAAPEMAKELLKFLTGPAAAPVLKTQGMEPG
jgi:molybdate transport system substrate-binding protein